MLVVSQHLVRDKSLASDFLTNRTTQAPVVPVLLFVLRYISAREFQLGRSARALGESAWTAFGAVPGPKLPCGPYRSCSCFHIAAVVKKEPRVTVFLDGRRSVCCN